MFKNRLIFSMNFSDSATDPFYPCTSLKECKFKVLRSVSLSLERLWQGCQFVRFGINAIRFSSRSLMSLGRARIKHRRYISLVSCHKSKLRKQTKPTRSKKQSIAQENVFNTSGRCLISLLVKTARSGLCVRPTVQHFVTTSIRAWSIWDVSTRVKSPVHGRYGCSRSEERVNASWTWEA